MLFESDKNIVTWLVAAMWPAGTSKIIAHLFPMDAKRLSMKLLQETKSLNFRKATKTLVQLQWVILMCPRKVRSDLKSETNDGISFSLRCISTYSSVHNSSLMRSSVSMHQKKQSLKAIS